MTREEAIKMAKADLKCMERDTSGQDEMCNSHKCDECSLNYERGNMGEQKEWLRLAIKALEQEPNPMIEIDLYSIIKQKYIEREVLNKIRAEIEALEDGITSYHNDRPWIFKDEVLQIIAKYKAESEG